MLPRQFVYNKVKSRSNRIKCFKALKATQRAEKNEIQYAFTIKISLFPLAQLAGFTFHEACVTS